MGEPVSNPFPGLRPFRTEESTLFFGRDDQIGEALDRMLRQKLLAVVGVSGCGKSSLVSAGMIPALEMGLAGDPEQHWRVAAMRPGDGPLRELGRCLGFGGELAERTYGLLEAVETHLPAGHNLLLVVDQFEEIFPFRDRKLREGAGSEADLFVSYLLRAALDQTGRVYGLLTMRSDYLGECAKFHGLPEALNDGQYLVPRMTRQQLQEAIEGPLAAVAVQMHPALVQELLNQCDEEPDNLPLLQHLLRRMFEEWTAEGAQGAITPAMATGVGGLAGALNQDAESVSAGLSSEELRISEVMFRRITESRRQADQAEDDRPVRRPQTVTALAELAGVGELTLRGVVKRFEERGLLVLRRTDQGDKVDLPHECLCLRWTRLKEWIRAEAEDAKKLRFLWDATERRAPLAGLALDEALEWQRDGRFEAAWCSRYLNAEQIAGVAAWVVESQRIAGEAAERERKGQDAEMRSRRVRRAALLLGVLAVAFALLGAWAYEQSELAKKQSEFANKSAEKYQIEQNRAEVAAKKARYEQVVAQDATLRATKAERAAEANLAVATKSKFEAEAAKARAEKSEQKSRDFAELYLASQLASWSDSVFRDNPGGLDKAVLLAIESMRWRPSAAGEKSFRQATGLLPLRRVAWTGPSAITVAFSSDAQWMATDAGVLDAATGKLLVPLPLNGRATTVAFSPDRKWVAMGGSDGWVRLMDARTGQQVNGLLREGVPQAMAFSSDGSLLLIGVNPIPGAATSQGAVEVLKASTFEVVKSIALHGRVRAVAGSADGKWIAVGTEDKFAWLIDATNFEEIHRFIHGKEVNAVAFSPDGKWLATGSDDNVARLIRTDGGGEAFRWRLQGRVRAVVFSPNGKWLAVGSDDRTARVMDTKEAREVARLPNDSVVQAVVFTPDGKHVETWGDDGGARLMEIPEPRPTVALHNQVEANSAVFSPDGLHLATGSKDGVVRVVESATGAGCQEWKLSDDVSAVAYSADGRVLMARTKDGTRLIDMATGKQSAGILDTRTVYALGMSADGNWSASGGEDKSVRLTDVRSGRVINLTQGAAVYAVAFSPDGKLLATGGEDGSAILWDLASGKEIWKVIYPARVYAASFSADGRWLVTGGGTVARVTEMATGRELHEIDIGSGILAAAHLSRDGRWLETIHQVSETDIELIYSRHLLDSGALVKEACGRLTRNLKASEWEQYAGGIPYRRTCENLPSGISGP